MEKHNSGLPNQETKGSTDKQNARLPEQVAHLNDPHGSTHGDDPHNHTSSIPGNQTDQPRPEGKTIAEATDPTKLSDI